MDNSAHQMSCSDAPPALVFAGYNVCRGIETFRTDFDFRLRASDILGEISAADPDVLVLNEMRLTDIDDTFQFEMHLRQMGYDGYVQASSRVHYGERNAVFWKRQVARVCSVETRDIAHNKVAFCIELETRDERVFVCTAHLALPDKENSQKSQIDIISQLSRGRENIVFFGDCNLFPDAETSRENRQALAEVFPAYFDESEGTWLGRRGDHPMPVNVAGGALDFMGGRGGTVVGKEIRFGRQRGTDWNKCASDHAMLVVTRRVARCVAAPEPGGH